MTIERNLCLRALALTIGASAALAVIPIAAQASVQNPTTSSVLSAAKAALSKQTSVHLLVTSKSGSTSSRVVADIGKTSGDEIIVSGSDDVTLTLTPDYAYISGNSAGLTSLMGLSAAEQKKVGKLAIAMKAGTTPYKDLKSSLTIPVLTGMLPATKGTTFSTTKIDNVKDYQLAWTTKASSSEPATKNVFVFSSAKETLPIKETLTASTGSGLTTFSKWGENIKESVPSSTISYSTVVG